MNEWNRIWAKRTGVISSTEQIFETFCELKRADGFDTQDIEGYYEAFFEQWKLMAQKMQTLCHGTMTSVYEVGCGSGVNLYLFERLMHLSKLGGLDYSNNLVSLARQVVTENTDIICEEALHLTVQPKYDAVIADSVFQYFRDTDYGYQVLSRMWDKAEKMLVITEIHDIEQKEQHLAYRRACVENYDEKYAGLDKTFYDKEMFYQFAERVNAHCEIVQPENALYWNNPFVFDCYIYR